MNARHAVIGFFSITVVYLCVLVWADSRNHVFSSLPSLARAMPTLFALSALTYWIRYVRWRWLLARAGSRTRYGAGLRAYLAGFALTATPGKVGELLRIRYLATLGVPAERVVAAFVFERLFDLIIVLALASLAVTRRDILALAFAFVGGLSVVLVLSIARPAWLTRVETMLRGTWLDRLAVPVAFLRAGLATSRVWLTVPDIAVALGCGCAAWLVASGAFVWLLMHLAIDIPLANAIAVFPLAMLAGAASMLPGGVGSTEGTIVVLLAYQGISVGVALLAAVGIRLSSLWFAILCGLVAAATFEVVWWRRPPAA